ncbi:uncharacterized protein LOC105437609 isoform X2 [Strongylocentrotus purpuratus]|nr:uncharacterized protein LOC105437609 isoform X2 [Strongylocentrotus purpuratus]
MQAPSYPTHPGVPDQTVYVHQPAPVNYANTVQNPNSSSSVSQHFNGAAGRATGWLQISIGIGSIVVAIAQLFIFSRIYTGAGFVAIGIWASVLFYIPTGILGICSMKKNTRVIIGYLTMSIITANVAIAQLIVGTIGALLTSQYGYYFGSDYCEQGIVDGGITSDSLLAILGLIEMVVAIVASAYCCRGMACCHSSSPTTTTMQVTSDMQAPSYPTQPGVPDQTVYVHQPAPVNYANTVQNPNSSSSVSQHFNGAAGRATGWLQISIGIGSIVVAIAQLFILSRIYTGLGFVAIGIWASVLFYIPTGILGICSMKKNTRVIIGYLTMSIITANVAIAQLIVGTIGALLTSQYGYYFGSDYREQGIVDGGITSDSLLAILGLIEMVVAIVASAYCCGGMACCHSSSPTTTTMYPHQNIPMVVTTGQYTQPAGIVQAPPGYNVQQAYPPAGQPVAPAPYNQAPGAPYNQASAPHYQALGAPYNQQAAAAPITPGEMVA